VNKEWTVAQAAGVIRLDFEKAVCGAESISFDELVAIGSLAEAGSQGEVRIKGKEYVAQNGDVVGSRFNS